MSYDQSPNGASNKKPKQAKGTEDIVRQHLKDPNHIITDEDIKNVEVGVFETTQEYEGEILEENAEIPKPEEGDSATPATPWEVLK
ncbi:MAG TPA: hypothetical protein VM935_03380 [Chitinophagaceae bacterium]|jgi:hypothetical protein|nr:hypothetical protein [Chitinophagaceae bacterium]